MKRIGLITGASSGLGATYARTLGNPTEAPVKLDELWLVARRRDRLEALARELPLSTRVLALDLESEAVWGELYRELNRANVDIALLVNAAGLGRLGDFATIEPTDHRSMLRINIEALTLMNQLVLPFLTSDARILNIASVAGFLPQTHFNVYAATKAYVIAHSRALNDELKARGITVTAVCPGPMETEFFIHATPEQQEGRASSIKRLGIEAPQTVVDRSLRASLRKRDLVVTGFVGKLLHVASRIIPHRFILWIEQQLGM